MKPVINRQQKRIRIYRTDEELQKIAIKVKELGKHDFNHYLRSEISRLEKIIIKYPESIIGITGVRIKKYHYIPATTYANLKRLSVRMNKPIDTIIDDLLIMPLLHPTETVHPNSF